jgi:hypothetical protein
MNETLCFADQIGALNEGFRLPIKGTHLGTDVVWREKIYNNLVFYKYFCLGLGLPRSRISKKSVEDHGRKPNFKLSI